MRESLRDIFQAVKILLLLVGMVGSFNLLAILVYHHDTRERAISEKCMKEHGDEVLQFENKCILEGDQWWPGDCRKDAIDFFCKKTTN